MIRGPGVDPQQWEWRGMWQRTNGNSTGAERVFQQMRVELPDTNVQIYTRTLRSSQNLTQTHDKHKA